MNAAHMNLTRLGAVVAGLLLAAWTAVSAAADTESDRVTLSMKDVELSEVMDMLSRQNRVNILLADDAEATVSFNLYDVAVDEAIRSISSAAGYSVERRSGTYFILPNERAGEFPGSGFTLVKTFPVQYADAAELESRLEPYLSEFGNITALPERKLLLVEDQPAFMRRAATMISDLDRRPQQVIIEARILEVTLTDETSFGIDWTAFFGGGDGSGTAGVQGLGNPGNAGTTGFFFDYLHTDYEFALNALEADGRVRNLASPKLVTIENEEAEVIIGDRRGYKVTTTINQVTSETIEFLESGVILRVTPVVDEKGRIMLDIHPEVSNGIVDENGIPSQTTTEVSTQLVVNSGQSIFIGGLLKNSTTEGRAGVPVLGKIPGVRWLFSSRTTTSTNTETVVLITPRLLDTDFAVMSAEASRAVDEVESEMGDRSEVIEQEIIDAFTFPGQRAEPANPEGYVPDVSESSMQTEAGSENEAMERTSNPEPLTYLETTGKKRPKPVRQTIEPAVVKDTPEPGILRVLGEKRHLSVEAEGTSEPSAHTVVAEQSKANNDLDGGANIAINLESTLDPLDTETIPTSVIDWDQMIYLTETQRDGRTWYRLRMGFFDTESQAIEALDALRSDYPDAWVVTVGPSERATADERLVQFN